MFEGAEKKLEIILAPSGGASGGWSLRSLPNRFWERAASACGASIVSTAKFPQADSRILSESSLFVWDRRAVFITCGKTSLPKAMLKVLKKISSEKIGAVFYQRKNEFFPWAQAQSFADDLRLIQKKIKGRAYRFGPLHGHHCFLFHSETDCRPDPEDMTAEILMYDSQTVRDCSQTTLKTLKRQLRGLFPHFEIQDHVFEPAGYSLNAVRGHSYYTIHITPEQPFFYISFEANIAGRDFIKEVLDIFQPRSFDLLLFSPSGHGGGLAGGADRLPRGQSREQAAAADNAPQKPKPGRAVLSGGLRASKASQARARLGGEQKTWDKELNEGFEPGKKLRKKPGEGWLQALRSEGFARTAFFHQALSCGYEVSYMSFSQSRRAPSAASPFGG